MTTSSGSSTSPTISRADARAELERRARQRRYQRDPALWIEERLGGFLWSGQRTIARSVVENRYTAVHSAHGTGKDWLAARLVAWWLDVHPLGSAFAVTTAPTSHQLEGILWRELGQCHRQAGLPGRLSGGSVPTWRIGQEIIAWGRKPQDLADPEAAASAMAGIHAEHVLIVIDEASGVEPWLWDAADALMTNSHARTLAIGNPLDGSSRFAEVCLPGKGWNVIEMSVFDTPAFTGEPVPEQLLKKLVSPEWVDERRRLWGEGTPRWRSRVLGKFPTVSQDSLIAPDWIRDAQKRHLEPLPNGQQAYGVDVARSGDDTTVIYAITGGRIRLRHEARKADTMATAGAVARLLNETYEILPAGHTPAWIDTIGVGAGVYDRLRELDHPVREFVASAKAWDPVHFGNLRAQAYWTLRQAFERGEVDLDPADQDLAHQLATIRWKTNSKGQIFIESKEEMRKRGLPSPDKADAAVMGWWGTHRGGFHVGVLVEAPSLGVWDPVEQRFRPHHGLMPTMGLESGPWRDSYTAGLLDDPM